MKTISKEYTNGEVTVVWKPDLCIHSGICFNGLPKVFKPKEKPWVDVMAAATDKIIQQVMACPSGALSYYKNEDEGREIVSDESEVIVEMMKDGPLMVYGNIRLKMHDGSAVTKHKVTALCRCGASSNKPYCDGTHKKINFKDA